jgi:hypothetical protein
LFDNFDLSNSILWASNMKFVFKIMLFIESKIKFYIRHDYLSIKRSNDTFLLNFLKLLFKLCAVWLGNKAFTKSSSTEELWSYMINSILFSKSNKLISSIKIDATAYLSINVAVLSYYLFFRAVFLVFILYLLNKISFYLLFEIHLGKSESFSISNLDLKTFV